MEGVSRVATSVGARAPNGHFLKFSASLLDDHHETHIIWIFLGSGGNGKSTIKRLFNVSFDTKSIQCGNYVKPDTKVIFFEDYQVNDVKFITDKFKSIFFTHEGKPKFSPVFLLDRIPHNLSSNDESAKYIRIIPFNQRFEHCSKDFNVKSIAQEFYSLVHSYVRIYKEEGLDEPLSFSTKYLLGGPSVICEQFIIENVSINSLYLQYQNKIYILLLSIGIRPIMMELYCQ